MMREVLNGTTEDLTEKELTDLIMKDVTEDGSDEDGSLSTLLTMIGYPSPSNATPIPTPHSQDGPSSGSLRSSPEEMISSITLLDPHETCSRWSQSLHHHNSHHHHHLEPNSHSGVMMTTTTMSEDDALVQELLREEAEVSSSTNPNHHHSLHRHINDHHFSSLSTRPQNIHTHHHHHFGHGSRPQLGYHHHPNSDSFNPTQLLPSLNVSQPSPQQGSYFVDPIRAHHPQYLDLSHGYHNHHHQRYYASGDLNHFHHPSSASELPDSSTSHLAPLPQQSTSSWSDSLLDLALSLNCEPESTFLSDELVRKGLSPTSTTTTASSLSDEEEEDSEFETTPTPSVNVPPPPLVVVKRKVGRPKKNAEDRRRKDKKTGRLWEFIRDLLKNPEYCPSLVRWENVEEGHFRFVNSEKVAQLWGQIKGNPRMTYEKLSRAMRYYYKNHVFEPVLGRRLVYKFGYNATNWKPLNVNFPNPVPLASGSSINLSPVVVVPPGPQSRTYRHENGYE